MWLHPAVDSYFVANEETRQELQRNGIAASRVYVTGIPIAAKFSESAVSTREGSPKLPTILVMGGGFGLEGVGRDRQQFAAGRATNEDNCSDW